MATKVLNKDAYEVKADNLVAAAQYPMLHRAVTVTNPKVAIVRGMAVINKEGTLYVAGAKSSGSTIAGDIVGIVSADWDADTTADTVTVDAFVSGAFNKGAVVALEDLDVTTDAYVLGAQGNGIYLL